MMNRNEQTLDAWDEWVAETGDSAGNPDAFMTWGLANGKLAMPLQDMRKILRKQITAALRQASRADSAGFSYRAKQCVIEFQAGGQIPLWFDTDTGGTPNLRRKAVRQRRDAIASDVYRAMCDVEHMNKQHGENIQFLLNFEDDYQERRAADLMGEIDDEDAA
jgi:hypothetical protein